jgi:rare lipoprotein A
MRIDVKTPMVVLALVAVLCLLPAGGALASAGGTSMPTGGAGTSTTPAHKVHPTGIATWFGPGFFGKETACGQTLTPGVVGVANRTLPCGTLDRDGYHGHRLTVPVLDRGPYSHIGADWDLTAGAAQALGITETVRIQTWVIGATANSPLLGLPATQPTALMAGGAVAG